MPHIPVAYLRFSVFISSLIVLLFHKRFTIEMAIVTGQSKILNAISINLKIRPIANVIKNLIPAKNRQPTINIIISIPYGVSIFHLLLFDIHNIELSDNFLQKKNRNMKCYGLIVYHDTTQTIRISSGSSHILFTVI